MRNPDIAPPAQRISEMDAYIKALEAGVNARLYDLAVNAFNSGR